MSYKPEPRRICFVTGTRAEFGLMRTTLQAIRAHPRLQLQLIATGMHLDPACGRSIRQIRAEGWTVDAVVPWKPSANSTGTALAMGKATSLLAKQFETLASDVVLVVGDRVEAFAAAAAGHVARRIIAHVHGGDRALGQVDDSLRHAISKLAHLHFPATEASAERLVRLGEDRWRIQNVGSPGIDGLRAHAASASEIAKTFPGLNRYGYVLLLLHPATGDPAREARSAKLLYNAVKSAGAGRVVIVGPNNDPGASGIMGVWESLADHLGVDYTADLPRDVFLGLMRDAAVLVGNSSSGIIEAASFGTPVLDVGDRQQGRDRGENVTAVRFAAAEIRRAISTLLRGDAPVRFSGENLYGRGNTGLRIASIVASALPRNRLLRKLIAY